MHGSIWKNFGTHNTLIHHRQRFFYAFGCVTFRVAKHKAFTGHAKYENEN